MAWAIAACALFLLWQFLTVHYNRGGNWTALFLTGKSLAIPRDLAPGTYEFPGKGYDGQMYRYEAHDLFTRQGYVKYIDGPAQRFHHLLVPALAYLLVAGYQPWIDGSYIAVIAIFALLGAFWLSRWAVLTGRHPAWALGFLLVPATLISMDRLTIDISLAAFTAAFAYYWRTAAWTRLFIVLLLACLARETGVLLAGGCCLADLFNRRIIRAVAWASSALPAFVWYVYVRGAFPEQTHFGVPTWVADRIAGGIFFRMLHPLHYPLSRLLDAVARSGDVIAFAAVLAAALLAILLLRARPLDPVATTAILFVVVILVMTEPVFWNDVNTHARIFSPLLLLVAMGLMNGTGGERWLKIPWWIGLVPAILVDLRLSMQLASNAGGIIRGLLR